jgi:hypothetical protein
LKISGEAQKSATIRHFIAESFSAIFLARFPRYSLRRATPSQRGACSLQGELHC